MKIKFTINLFLLTLLVIPLMAQERPGDKPPEKFDYNKLKADKIAYITDAIDLTPKEAEVFWPVYNEYEKKKWDLMKERRELDKSLLDGVKEMSNEEYTQLSKKLAAFPVEDGKLTQEYNEKFLEILPPKKVVELYLAEINFRNHLLRNFRDEHKRDDNNN